MITLGTSASKADLELVRDVLRKDRKATAEFVQLYSDPVYRYLRFRLHPRIEAVDDLMQEVFLTAWKSLQRYAGDAPLRAWILGIARHKVQDHYRQVLRASPFPEDAEDLVEPRDSLELVAMHRQSQDNVLTVLASLSDDYRLVLLWRYWEQKSAAEIAEEIGRSTKAVERLLSRARQKFKLAWQSQEAAQ